MKKNVGICISKCLKSAAKNRRANQTARAILTAPTVHTHNNLWPLYTCQSNVIRDTRAFWIKIIFEKIVRSISTCWY